MEDKLENNRLKYIDYTFKRHGIDPDSIEGQLIYYAYGHGYHQAEKDLELGWVDMFRIDEIITQVFKESKTCQMEALYQEVLKRFKERNKKMTWQNGTEET